MMTRPHVLIIDDDSAACASACALLNAFDFDVTSFNSAEAFLAAESRAETACLPVDVQLPGMSGSELLKTVQQQRGQPPVILITGYADSALTLQAVENGAVAVLEKPVNPRTLVENIHRAIGALPQPEETDQTNI